MDRAKVIIHMYMSIDGKIDGDWVISRQRV